ncbi:MAG TPA: DUF4230 domain-containing protein [Chthoniobacteraceae bacterium]|nr:DUF4230 domain-containing protein [Chthoniobacteraceae bacterium]
MSEIPAPPPRRGISWKLVLLVIVLAAIGTGAWIFYRIETWPERTSQRVLKAFREVGQIQPKITIKDRVVFEQTKDALELAVVTRETQVEREMEHEWLGSKKRIRLRGTFNVKAGFDLREQFAVKIEGRHIRAELPPPKILSIDTKDTEVLLLENGFWNKINPKDLEVELQALPELARSKAVQIGLPNEALETFIKRVREQLAPAYELEFIQDPKPKL